MFFEKIRYLKDYSKKLQCKVSKEKKVMSGYIVKIMIEKTHPPVWRRIVLPEKIRFYDLHKIIQITFGWEGVHLHDFSFPNDWLRIISPGDEKFGRTALETKALLDDYIRSFNWIRYTYDFGNDWSHKIIFEKEDPEYKNRYATILKAKGNNFMEDSRGIFYEDGEYNNLAVMFSLENTNEKLKNLLIPSRKGELKKSQKYKANDLAKIFRDFEKGTGPIFDMLARNARINSMKSNSLSQMKSGIENWEVFAREEATYRKLNYKNNELKDENKTIKLKDEQISMSFMEEPKGTTPVEQKRSSKHNIYEIYKVQDTKTIGDNLDKLNIKEARDYCKYLQLPYKKSTTKKELIEKITKLLLTEPQYFLWVLDNQEWTELEHLLKDKRGLILNGLNINTINRAMSLGLIDCKYTVKGLYHRAELSLVTEMESILRFLTKTKRNKEYSHIETMIKQISPILVAFGMIDLDSLYTKYHEYWNGQENRSDLLRFVYWYGRFNNHFLTFDNSTNRKSYVALPEVDIKFASILHEQYMKNEIYKNYKKDEIILLKKGFNEIYRCWNDYKDYLQFFLDMKEDMISIWLTDAFIQVENGATSTDLMNALQKIHKPETILMYKELWFILLNVVMETGLIGLKGYSREEYMGLGRRFPELLPATTDNDNTVYTIIKTTHLYEMPQGIQLQVYGVFFMEPVLAAKKMEEIIKKFGHQNEELRLCLIEIYIMGNQFEEAERVINLMKQDNDNNDESIEDVLEGLHKLEEINATDDIFEDGLMNEIFVRENENLIQFPIELKNSHHQKKKIVGRNDSCPCGSGRKYKACCGK